MKQNVAATRRRPGRPRKRDPDDNGNRTLLVGIEMLKTLSRLLEPASLSEIARATDMAPSRARRYLSSLVQLGLAQRDEWSGKFSLGPTVIELGTAALARVDGFGIASDALKNLTSKLRLVSHICVWGSNGPTVIRWEQGDLDIAIRIREGFNLSVLTTSSGRIFLAYFDEARVAPVLRRNMDEWNATVPVSRRFTPAKIRALRKVVQEDGLSCVVGLRTPHLAAISAPIFNRDGLAMSMTISGAKNSFDASVDGEAARELKAVTSLVSRRLGAVTAAYTDVN